MNDDPRKWAYLFFQIVFAGTAATIVSGAIAERARLIAYLIGTAIVTVFVYPVVGHWAWGGGLNPNQQGWLAELGFMDFAGSSIVHSVGGWIAFAAAIVIGPRVGKYGEDGSIRRFTPSNLIFATLGTFLLWFGWFGFNAGSTLTAGPEIALITLNTALGGAAGGFAAMTASWVAERRPRAEDMLNGVLGGLVSVTAGVQRAAAARRRPCRDARRPDRIRIGTFHRRRAQGGRCGGRDLGPRRLRRVGDARRRPVRQRRTKCWRPDPDGRKSACRRSARWSCSCGRLGRAISFTGCWGKRSAFA